MASAGRCFVFHINTFASVRELLLYEIKDSPTPIGGLPGGMVYEEGSGGLSPVGSVSL